MMRNVMTAGLVLVALTMSARAGELDREGISERPGHFRIKTTADAPSATPVARPASGGELDRESPTQAWYYRGGWGYRPGWYGGVSFYRPGFHAGFGYYRPYYGGFAYHRPAFYPSYWGGGFSSCW